MKTVTVKLTIDQWQLPSLVEAVGELADVFKDEILASPDGYLLQPETRAQIQSGCLFDVYELLNEINEQSRSQ